MMRIDQTYTVIDISLTEFPEEIIVKLKTLHPNLALARISATKFDADREAKLKLYVYHWLFAHHEPVIADIYNYFNKYTISKKVIAHQ